MQGTERRPVGRTGIMVSALGVGGGTLATGGDEGKVDAMLRGCWDGGLRYYDTAPLYGNSESMVGRFLSRFERQSYVVSDKVGRLPAPAGERRFDFSRPSVEQSVETSLNRPGTDYIDLLSVHDLTPAMLGESYPAMRDEFLHGAVDLLVQLKRDHIVHSLGLALYDCAVALEQLQGGAFDYVMIVGACSLLCQDALTALLPYCSSQGIGLLSASPFHTGLLVSGAVAGARFNYRPADAVMLAKVRRIEGICAAHAVSLPAAALQYPLRYPAIASVVVGHQAPSEVATNLAWLREPIPQAFWDDLVREELLPPDESLRRGGAMS